MRKENVQYGEIAEQFRKGALSIIPLYDVFWSGIIEERNRKWLRTLGVSKEKARKIASLALNGSLRDSTKVKLGQFLNPSREYVYEIATKIISNEKNSQLEKIYNIYVTQVVQPLVMQWYSWLIKIAKSSLFTPTNIDFEDRLSYIIIGFLRGIHKYDFNSDNAITTVCYYWIKDTLINGIFKEKSIVKVTHTVRVNAMKNENNSNDTDATDDMSIVYSALNPISLTNLVEKQTNRSTLSNSNAYVEDVRQYLQLLLRRYLADDEYTLLTYKYGLFDANPHTVDELTDIMDMPKSSVYKKLKEITNKLKKVADLQTILNEIVELSA